VQRCRRPAGSNSSVSGSPAPQLRTAALLATLPTKVTHRSGKEHTMTVTMSRMGILLVTTVVRVTKQEIVVILIERNGPLV
jgi:hypothetical protein